jgi:pimeloyl-ACP methyl ester carboxylesterase/DNA-binding winged helix-turn-helix (wHTH) protein/class 3 adenylate cyclase
MKYLSLSKIFIRFSSTPFESGGSMSDKRVSSYEFGAFRLDPGERLLVRDREVVPLTPKMFDLLLVLVENGGHMLAKRELMHRVWPDAFIEEANLAQNISKLRKALGETEGGRKYIETVPKRGYRFVAEVREVRNEPATVFAEEKRLRVMAARGHAGAARISVPSPVRLSPAAPVPAVQRFSKLPETRYARSGDVNVAYQVVGDAPLDLLFVMGWVSHLEYFWTEPSLAHFLSRLASFSRLILFDKRGTGLSDRVPIDELPTLEQRMDDVRAVLDAVGSRRAVLCGVSEGGPMCSLYAATYPEKTLALIMIGTYALRLWEPGYPWAPTREQRQHFFDEIEKNWGGPVGLEERAPSMMHDPAFREWWGTYLRMGASPGAAVALTRMNTEIDIRDVLPTIRVPTLVLHRTGDSCLKVEEGRYVAGRIPGARFVELPGVDHLPFVGDQDSILDEIELFLTGVRNPPEHDRVLSTVLVTAAVNPAGRTLDATDPLPAGLLERHLAYARKEVSLFRGREIETVGGRMLAAFDGPARAIRCACAIVAAARRLGIQAKAGLHTGECDLEGDRVEGIAVKTGFQVSERAGAGEILVSRTVKDLVAGSGIQFADRGIHVLEGIPGSWRLFSVG